MDQQLPRGDSRYRVHRSVKFYVAELMVGSGGATWYVNDSAERVVHHYDSGARRIVYRGRLYRIRPPEELIELAREHLTTGGAVIVGWQSYYPGDDLSFDPYPFIDVTPAEDHAAFKAILASAG